MTKPTKWVCARPVWSESSLSAWRNLGSLATLWARSEDWSDWVDAQADLSLRWAHPIMLVLSCRGSLLFGKRVTLNPGQGGVRDVASVIISQEQTQSNRVCCFQILDAIFPKDPFSDYQLNRVWYIHILFDFLAFKDSFPVDLINESDSRNMTLSETQFLITIVSDNVVTTTGSPINIISS